MNKQETIKNQNYKRLVLFICLILTGCGDTSRLKARITGISEICHDGVIYIQLPSGVTVKYNRDGTIMQCLTEQGK